MKHVKTFKAHDLSEVEGLVNNFLRQNKCELIQICEDLTNGTSKACPATWTDTNALTALLSNNAGSGLSLGDIPANAKY